MGKALARGILQDIVSPPQKLHHALLIHFPIQVQVDDGRRDRHMIGDNLPEIHPSHSSAALSGCAKLIGLHCKRILCSAVRRSVHLSFYIYDIRVSSL